MGRRRAPGPGALGRALIRQNTQRSRNHRHSDSWLHTSELNDGYDWGRLNLQSVTEQSSLDDFLATAELAGTEFVAEKLNIKFVHPEARAGLLSFEESQRIKKLHEENKQFLSVPRRPKWDKNTSPEELKQAEKDNFLEWRRQLVRLEEEQKLLLTPFERNLDFWRQLWRVIERSDIVVQIVDARNPLLFRCEDLECYVKEIDDNKENVILINKADLLTAEQRSSWATYFEKENVKIIFWSALAEAIQLIGDSKEQANGGAGEANTAKSEKARCEEAAVPHSEPGHLPDCGSLALSDLAPSDEDSSEYEDCPEEEEEVWQTCSEEDNNPDEEASGQDWQRSCTADSEAQGRKPLQKERTHNFSHLVSRQELLEIFKQLHNGKKVKDGQLTVGLVGYPNVGKSSTINTIVGDKKVSVSATPGHTKHFQTLYVEPGLCLCDCPGLVMPSFVSTKAEMICNGILPIDQMRDHVPPVSLVCQNIPRHVLEATYGINIIKPREDEDPCRLPTSEELLTAYGYMRGFMTAHGQPDQPRSARYILKDYVSGQLLYCHPPPGRDPVTFQQQHQRLLESQTNGGELKVHPGRNKKATQIENIVDKTFFHQENVRALTKGVQAVMGYKPGSGMVTAATVSAESRAGKAWKKHGNRNKKEKSRRLYKHLDT
ncbi:large subunit GTPase 1 homolog isoform X1 [Mirounga angustirostris]|uniref:large subunit GTPase 1 homolog n=1 Tax=Mirounga leonina TaxID=9715 RepID=UPI00156C191B|nr:large subunit GTPase 1 homolog [Mirounga leonina]XP_045759088.1 large subunit GTPase 1 homolog [Mirounga angustirostris]